MTPIIPEEPVLKPVLGRLLPASSFVNCATSSALKKNSSAPYLTHVYASREETTHDKQTHIRRSKKRKKLADEVRGGDFALEAGIYKSQVGLKFRLVRIRSSDYRRPANNGDVGEYLADDSQPGNLALFCFICMLLAYSPWSWLSSFNILLVYIIY